MQTYSDKIILIKFGGSLIKYAYKICKYLKKYKNIVIIPGGSIFADFIRDVYDEYKLEEDVAHILAILSMEQYGYYLNKFLSFYQIFDLNKIRLPGIIMPYNILKDDIFLEKSWKITSDSISCYLAYKLGIRRVLKITDVDGIYIRGKIIKKITSDDLIKLKFKPVDDYLGKYIKKFKITFQIINGRNFKILDDAIRGRDVGTIIIP